MKLEMTSFPISPKFNLNWELFQPSRTDGTFFRNMAILRKSTIKFLTCWALINYSFAPPFQHVPKTKYTFLEGKPSTKKSIIINFLKITSGSAHLCWKCKFRNFWDRNNISQNKTKNSIWFSFCQIRTFSFHVLSELVFLLWINIITNVFVDFFSIFLLYKWFTSNIQLSCGKTLRNQVSNP